jgi:hypothetical protein
LLRIIIRDKLDLDALAVYPLPLENKLPRRQNSKTTQAGPMTKVTPTALAPAVADTLVWSDKITLYDQEHFITYARLLDAEADEADWRDAARIILRLDLNKNLEVAKLCWQIHLDRAKWISTTAFQGLIDKINAREAE